MASKVSLIFLASFIVVMGELQQDWTSQCDRCKCKWSGGKKFADCRNASYNTIPDNLSNELRDIDFSNNLLYELRAREFSNKNLSDVHKLKLVNCSIRDVNYKAFEGLSLLIELDLSDNKILKLSADVFKSNSKLRVVLLANNKLKTLEEGLFAGKSHLQRISLNNNLLEDINSNVFGKDCNVSHMDLGHNKLKKLDGHFLDDFVKIASVTLGGNPWMCDCHLQDFRNVSMIRNLITSYTVCEEPAKLKGQLWNDQHLVFACIPEIIEPNFQEPIDVTSSNYTISCKVQGVPTPDIEWVTNGRIIDRDPRQTVQKYVTTKTKQGSYVWNNLTIINFNYRDKGEYKCVAKNPGGVTERNVTLLVSGSMIDGTYYNAKNPLPLIIGLIIGALVLLIIIFVLIYCCCRRTGRDNNVMAKNRSLSQSNEFVSLDGHHNEMGKALITEVNPIVKPPRQQSVPASVISGGTEVSETKKMLDEDSMYGDEESRSLDFDRYQSKPPSNLNIDYRGESHFPPDLLPFTHRTMPQVSPAGSSASTVVADAARLPAHHGPQSPIQPPYFDAYRTLPYSRSHSPFTSPHAPPIKVPRQGGYVTVPRRPRQSWSSEPPTSDIGEPLYDNLGLRTTATGSSVLSLNRIGDGTPKTSTPKANNRPNHPLSPNLVPIPCDPIAEHDSPPMAQTLPRSVSANRAFSPNAAETMRANWTRSPEPNDSRRESTASLLPTPDGKAPKIPPRPPPKPKKRASTGPLFEDEGEDGTEV